MEILELKIVITEMKIFPKGLNSKFEMADKRLSNLQNTTIEIIPNSKDKRLNDEHNLRDQ